MLEALQGSLLVLTSGKRYVNSHRLNRTEPGEAPPAPPQPYSTRRASMRNPVLFLAYLTYQLRIEVYISRSLSKPVTEFISLWGKPVM